MVVEAEGAKVEEEEEEEAGDKAEQQVLRPLIRTGALICKEGIVWSKWHFIVACSCPNSFVLSFPYTCPYTPRCITHPVRGSA